MHKLLGALTILVLVAGLASAADEKRAQSPQPRRMTECNAQASDKKLTGDARKGFMADCLKGHSTREATSKEQQTATPEKSTGSEHPGRGEKMKVCNQEASAKNLHGDDRKHFMSECLKAEKKL